MTTNTTPMAIWRTLTVLVLLTVGCGCWQVTVREQPHAQQTDTQAAPVDDGRSTSSILNESTSLRRTMGELEAEHDLLAADVDAQERRKDELKDQRKAVEKQRDRYKDMLDD